MERLFFSYGRGDSEFVLKLAKDLRAANIDLWIDQLDIAPGERWDGAIEAALAAAPSLLVVLSPESVKSQNVMDEVSLGFDEGKKIIPVLLKACVVPFRLRRLQYADFTVTYEKGLRELLGALRASPHGNDVSAPDDAARARDERTTGDGIVQQPSEIRREAAPGAGSQTPAGGGSWRAKVSTVVIAGVVAVLLLGALAALAPQFLKRGQAPPPSQPSGSASSSTSSGPKHGLSDFTGAWQNADSQTRGITRLAIRADGANIFVSAWGKCHPSDCEWGEVPAQAFGENISAAGGANIRTISALFKTNFSEATLTIRPGDGSALDVEDMTHFTDNSGRANYASSYVFRRAP